MQSVESLRTDLSSIVLLRKVAEEAPLKATKSAVNTATRKVTTEILKSIFK